MRHLLPNLYRTYRPRGKGSGEFRETRMAFGLTDDRVVPFRQLRQNTRPA